jgi:hypothetical protein
MRKAITMFVVLGLSVSLYANNNASDKSRDLSRPSVATHHPEFKAPNGRTEEWEIWMTDGRLRSLDLSLALLFAYRDTLRPKTTNIVIAFRMICFPFYFYFSSFI